jgi:MinD-like ATPase involved in chromosome partitioning or flagellar assembly
MIITFYSYKAGFGKTTLVANLAAYFCNLLNKKVLIIDWDIATPEIDLYFDFDRKEIKKGLIDLLTDYNKLIQSKNLTKEKELPKLFDKGQNSTFIKRLRGKNSKKGLIDLLPVSNYNDNYWKKINGFDWHKFYETYYGKYYIEKLKEELNNSCYDYVLIDAGSGVNQYSTICNIQLPQMNIIVMSPSEQNFRESLDYIQAIKKNAYVKKNLKTPIILPVLSKIYLNNKLAQQHIDEFYNKFKNEFILIFYNLFLKDNLKENERINLDIIELNYFIHKKIICYDSEYSSSNYLMLDQGNGIHIELAEAFFEIAQTIEQIVNARFSFSNLNFENVLLINESQRKYKKAFEKIQLKRDCYPELEKEDFDDSNEEIIEGSQVKVSVRKAQKVYQIQKEPCEESDLHVACSEGKINEVKSLITSGYDVNSKDSTNLTPIMRAAANGHKSIVKLLVEYGAKITYSLLCSVKTKIDILEEEANLGKEDPYIVASWKNFLDYLIKEGKKQ